MLQEILSSAYIAKSQSISGAANFGVSLHLSDERELGDSFSNVVTVSPGVRVPKTCIPWLQ